ncbi:ABC transporter permease [Photobacterium leiognathi]|uniref:ABC transporter permease n=1 Tax=Photobacterium leiognathi TaxID=553611 RepID=UPI000D16E0D3|nr:ABC transporter permease [Photobacterium leiognathi]PSW57329.1 multidrug ABC transporter permease [Photobacterium leiognathi subsp. mandapamensis]
MNGFQYVKQEWRNIWKDGWLRALTLWLPAVLFLTMWAIFSAGIAHNLPVGVVDLDHSQLSRHFTRYVDASPTMAVTRQFTSPDQGSEAMRANEIYAMVVIPDNFEKDTKLGYSPQITTFYNGQFILIGKLINSAMLLAEGTFNAGVETVKNMATGAPVPLQAMGQAVPIRGQITPLFNSNSHYGQFLVSAIIPSIWQILIVATTVLAIAHEARTQGLWQWLKTSPVSKLMGKLAAYTGLFLIQGLLFLWWMYVALDWPMHGDWHILIVAQLLMVLACQSMGAFIYFLAMEVPRAMSFVAAFTAPAFAFMGITFPATDMPVIAKMWRSLLPVSHYIEVQLQQVDYGTGWYQASHQLFVLSWFMVAMVLAVMLMLVHRRKALSGNTVKGEA